MTAAPIRSVWAPGTARYSTGVRAQGERHLQYGLWELVRHPLKGIPAFSGSPNLFFARAPENRHPGGAAIYSSAYSTVYRPLFWLAKKAARSARSSSLKGAAKPVMMGLLRLPVL